MSTDGKSRAGQPSSRQEPGSACEACRRRKLRCDRQQPRCALCAESGEDCVFMPSRKRGPKRGHMKTLLARLAAMEERLGGATPDSGVRLDSTTPPAMDAPNPTDTSQQATENASPFDLSDWTWHDACDYSAFDPNKPLTPPNTSDGNNATEDMDSVMALLLPSQEPPTSLPPMEFSLLLPTPEPSSSMPSSSMPSSSMPPTSMPLTELSPNIMTGQNPFVPAANMINTCSDTMACMLPDLHHSDRDQAYFERVHKCFPILHEQRYYSWSYSLNKTPQQKCLQQSMWALATSTSAQPLAVSNALYIEARQRLVDLENSGEAHQLDDLMQAQAWLLLAIYELMRVDFRWGWLSAGRAFRRIQLIRLHEMDRCVDTLSPQEWTSCEESRRTFWMAYALDCFVSLGTDSARTLSEDADVRMPAPEANFQSGQPVTMNFLSDAMRSYDSTGAHTYLTDFIISATLCGWAHSHRQQCMNTRSHSDPLRAFWERHRQIERVLVPQIAAMSASMPPSMMRHADPISLFTNVMLQATTIYMYRTMVEFLPTQVQAYQALIEPYMTTFINAVYEMSNLSSTLSSMSCFKAHPYCPIALYVGIQCLSTFIDSRAGFSKQVQIICSALDNLRRINIIGDMSKSAGPRHRNSVVSNMSSASSTQEPQVMAG